MELPGRYAAGTSGGSGGIAGIRLVPLGRPWPNVLGTTVPNWVSCGQEALCFCSCNIRTDSILGDLPIFGCLQVRAKLNAEPREAIGLAPDWVGWKALRADRRLRQVSDQQINPLNVCKLPPLRWIVPASRHVLRNKVTDSGPGTRTLRRV